MTAATTRTARCLYRRLWRTIYHKQHTPRVVRHGRGEG